MRNRLEIRRTSGARPGTPRRTVPGARTSKTLLAGAGMAFWLAAVNLSLAQPGSQTARPPRLSPDYAGVVIPPNIAPLNFKIQEPGARYQVEIHSLKGEPIAISTRSPSIRIPAGKWRALLRANPGGPLCFDVSVRDARGEWSRFQTVTNSIAAEDIDRTLVYRLLKPLYSLYVNVGIYQRDLESFEERPVLENGKTEKGCLNCHTPLNHRPDTFAFHTRSPGKIQPMILVVSNQVARVDKTMGYMSWHPSGRLLAFSANKLNLFYHTHGETRDVFDSNSNLGIYRLDSNNIVVPPALALPDRNETWPSWAPDGRYLYYCSAPRLPMERFRQVRYDLMRIGYNIEQDRWGEPEVLLAAEHTGLSAAQPRVSPNGRWLVVTLARYGNFPIYQPSADLYVIDLRTREGRRLGINSDQADSWHEWSANGHWLVFSSKRLDGLFARPFFSYVDDQGQFYKPFVLPQADPAFYESYLKTFNVPELVTGPITVKEADLARAVLNPLRILTPTGDTRPAHKASSAAVPGGENQEDYKPSPQ